MNILMFNTNFKTFTSFVTIFLLFLLAFSISFFMLIQNQEPFDTIGKEFSKTVNLMLGEFEYEGISEFWPVSEINQVKAESNLYSAESFPKFDSINFYIMFLQLSSPICWSVLQLTA